MLFNFEISQINPMWFSRFFNFKFLTLFPPSYNKNRFLSLSHIYGKENRTKIFLFLTKRWCAFTSAHVSYYQIIRTKYIITTAQSIPMLHSCHYVNMNMSYRWVAPGLNNLSIQGQTPSPSPHTHGTVHSRQTTLWLQDLCLEILTVHGNELPCLASPQPF